MECGLIPVIYQIIEVRYQASINIENYLKFDITINIQYSDGYLSH